MGNPIGRPLGGERFRWRCSRKHEWLTDSADEPCPVCVKVGHTHSVVRMATNASGVIAAGFGGECRVTAIRDRGLFMDSGLVVMPDGRMYPVFPGAIGIGELDGDDEPNIVSVVDDYYYMVEVNSESCRMLADIAMVLTPEHKDNKSGHLYLLDTREIWAWGKEDKERLTEAWGDRK